MAPLGLGHHSCEPGEHKAADHPTERQHYLSAASFRDNTGLLLHGDFCDFLFSRCSAAAGSEITGAATSRPLISTPRLAVFDFNSGSCVQLGHQAHQAARLLQFQYMDFPFRFSKFSLNPPRTFPDSESVPYEDRRNHECTDGHRLVFDSHQAPIVAHRSSK